MIDGEVRAEYFNWLCGLIDNRRFGKDVSYIQLLSHLDDIPFRYTFELDENRYNDGISLRKRFASDHGFEPGYFAQVFTTPCSVFEMMVALALRCEETIMDNPAMGNRTGQWFWGMIVSLGLGHMSDERYDEEYIDYVVDKFLNRDYAPNGKGGLFTVRNTEIDLRRVEIWRQLMAYLDNIGE